MMRRKPLIPYAGQERVQAPKPRDPRPLSELAIHCAIADLLQSKGLLSLIWFHVPNGEERPGAVGAKLKRMGVRPGVADFALTLPDGRSAYLEVKSDRGAPSPDQDAFRADCERIGTPYAVVRSSEEAEQVLWSWGALRGPAPDSWEQIGAPLNRALGKIARGQPLDGEAA